MTLPPSSCCLRESQIRLLKPHSLRMELTRSGRSLHTLSCTTYSVQSVQRIRGLWTRHQCEQLPSLPQVRQARRGLHDLLWHGGSLEHVCTRPSGHLFKSSVSGSLFLLFRFWFGTRGRTIRTAGEPTRRLGEEEHGGSEDDARDGLHTPSNAEGGRSGHRDGATVGD